MYILRGIFLVKKFQEVVSHTNSNSDIWNSDIYETAWSPNRRYNYTQYLRRWSFFLHGQNFGFAQKVICHSRKRLSTQWRLFKYAKLVFCLGAQGHNSRQSANQPHKQINFFLDFCILNLVLLSDFTDKSPRKLT